MTDKANEAHSTVSIYAVFAVALIVGLLAYNWHNNQIREIRLDEELGTYALASYQAACSMSPWEPTAFAGDYDLALTGQVLDELSLVGFDYMRPPPTDTLVESMVADRWMTISLLMAGALRSESWAQIDEIDVVWNGRDYSAEMNDLRLLWSMAEGARIQDPTAWANDWFQACMRMSRFSTDLE